MSFLIYPRQLLWLDQNHRSWPFLMNLTSEGGSEEKMVLTGCIYQNIARFDISVNNLQRMQISQTTDYVVQHL